MTTCLHTVESVAGWRNSRESSMARSFLYPTNAAFHTMTRNWCFALICLSILVCLMSLEFLTNSSKYTFRYLPETLYLPGFSAPYSHNNKSFYVKDFCNGGSAELTTPRKKVLAYTIFGTDSLKRYGWMIKDVAAEAARSPLYNQWRVWVYHEGDVTPAFAEEVLKINARTEFCNVRNVDNVLKTNLANTNGMSWRFLPIGDASVDIACPRDLDSPLYPREEVAVKEWLASGKILHVMRDSIYHTSEIMGGLWCFRNVKNRKLGKQVMDLAIGKSQGRNSEKKAESQKGDDQNVLNKYVWPLLAADSMHHDSYLCSKYKGSIPYSTQRNTTFIFIGCRRPCHGTMEDTPMKCPAECRPPAHKDWEFC